MSYKVECSKCSGKGNISAFGHVLGGVCFSCNGVGYKVLKNKPRPSKSFVFFYLWNDPNDCNYMGGEYCRCYTRKFRNMAAAERHADVAVTRNGSVAYRIEEIN